MNIMEIHESVLMELRRRGFACLIGDNRIIIDRYMVERESEFVVSIFGTRYRRYKYHVVLENKRIKTFRRLIDALKYVKLVLLGGPLDLFLTPSRPEILSIESEHSIDRNTETEAGSGDSIYRKQGEVGGKIPPEVIQALESYKHSAFLVLESTARSTDPKTLFIDLVSLIQSRSIKWQNVKDIQEYWLGDGKLIIIKTIYGFFTYHLMFQVDERGHYTAYVVRETSEFGKQILGKMIEALSKANS